MVIKLQYLFYVIGIFFLFATIAYFAYEYVFTLSRLSKTIILFGSSVAFFFVGEYLKERGI